MQEIASFETRGWEIVEFKPAEGWSCIGQHSGTKYPDIDLTEGDWNDYDETADCCVGIYDLTTEIK